MTLDQVSRLWLRGLDQPQNVDFRKVRTAQVAERRFIPSRKFESTTFGELLDFWWDRHAKQRNNKFEYLLPRLDQFKPVKARKLTSETIRFWMSFCQPFPRPL